MAHSYHLEVFYDGGCPLCRREIDMLRRRDRHGRIRFTDIDAADFAPESTGRSYDDLMARIQACLPDGTWIEGVEVFRRLYAAAGFRRLVRFSRLPIIAPLLEIAYRLFARNRLRLTGRCSAAICRTKPTVSKSTVAQSRCIERVNVAPLSRKREARRSGEVSS